MERSGEQIDAVMGIRVMGRDTRVGEGKNLRPRREAKEWPIPVPWPTRRRRLRIPDELMARSSPTLSRGRRLDLLASLFIIGGGGANGACHGYGRRQGARDAG
jgi:hypothetical protein